MSQRLERDYLYLIITFFSPYEVIQLFMVCKEWNQELKLSNFWEDQCKKHWRLPFKITNYFEYFRNRVLFLQNISTSFGSRKTGSIYGNPLDDQVVQEYMIQMPSESDSNFSIVTPQKFFSVQESFLKCIDIKSQQVIWEFKWDFSKFNQIDYSILYDVLILGERSKIIAIHPQNGRIIWILEDEIFSNFIIRGGIIILYLQKSKFMGLDIETGKEIWSLKKDCNIMRGFICSKGFKVIFSLFENNTEILEFNNSFRIPPSNSFLYHFLNSKTGYICGENFLFHYIFTHYFILHVIVF